jgi:hypothetical protein
MTEKFSEERIEKFRQMIANPAPGSKVAAALEAGVDFTEMLENLKLTPTERIEKLQRKINELETKKNLPK